VNQRQRQMALVAYRAVSDVAGKGAFFLVTLVAARRLSQDAFGLFSLGTTVGWIAAVATDFGIQLHLARAVAQRPDDAARLLRAWLRVRLWTSVVALASVGVGLAVAKPARDFSWAILLFTLIYVVNGLIEFLHYFYRGIARSDVESTLTLWQRAAMLALAVAALWWRPDVTVLGIAMAIPALATFLYSSRLAGRLANAVNTSARSGPRTDVDGSNPRGAIGSVIPIGAGIVLSALYFRIDVFLVQASQGTAAVGLYNAVFRLVEALRLFPAAVLAVALQVIFQTRSRDVLVRLSSILTAAAVVASAVLWVGADRAIPLLYGSRYATAVPAFRVLLLAFPLMSLNYALTHQLIGWHGHRAYAVMCGLALIFNVGVNLKLIPLLGIVGAAWSTVATELVITLGSILALARLSNPAERLKQNVSKDSHLSAVLS
jgi:O-antigen/teichoic acid export membrane protein